MPAFPFHLVLAEFQFTHLLPVAGIIMIITSLMMWQRKRKLRGSCLSPAEELERNKQLRGMRGDLEELMVEIEQLAKRLSTQLDAKTIELDMAVHRADERLKELRRLSDGGASLGNAASTAGSGGKAGASGGASAATATTAPPQAEVPEQGPVDPLARSVHQLADKGLTATAIAQQLNEHIGKIELILALRQPSRANLG